ncbi:hypothetical protein D3C72_2260530 [compost metagenome]
MVIEHPVDDGRGILPGGNHTARSRRHPIVLSQVDPRQVNDLGRRSPRHRTHLDGRYHPGATAGDLEVQIIIQ